jgi:hypothetical protein
MPGIGRLSTMAEVIVERHLSSVERNLRLEPAAMDLAAVLRPFRTS